MYPRSYQEDFIKNIYDGHTLFEKKTVARAKIFSDYGTISTDIPADGETSEAIDPSASLRSRTIDEAKKRNETAQSRVIGMAIETRPDWITHDEIRRLRYYGVTRVEIGYQTTHDEINQKNKRGHGNAESILATKMLKDAGFKVVAHMMP